MGNGSSCSRATTMRPMATVKLIQLDGELKEFYVPVKVRSLLQDKDPDSFICNSDEMEFDGMVKAINGDEELQVGQLYFELPMSLLNRPLQAEEMASLAVKASAALRRSRNININETEYGCCYGFNSKRVDPGFVFYSSSSSSSTHHHHEDNDHHNYSNNLKTTQHPNPKAVMFLNPNVMVSVKKMKNKKKGILGNYIPGRFTGKLSVISEED